MSKASKKYWKENQQSITNIFDYAEAYHQSEVDADYITANLTVKCDNCGEEIEFTWERKL